MFIRTGICRKSLLLLPLLAAVPLAYTHAGNITLAPDQVKDIFMSSVELEAAALAVPQYRDSPISPLEYRERARAAARPLAMPPLKPGEYGTDIDNQNNAGTGVADKDMDVYLFNTSSITPIEFDIVLPAGSVGKTGTLRMDVYDVDAVSGEVDKVYVNGTQVGVLNGTTDTWGINIFAIPNGLLKVGRNRVSIDVDTKNPKKGIWAVTIDWGIISLGTSTTATSISRCWIAPPRRKAGEFVNFFAEVNNKVASVRAYIAGYTVKLTDPDGDNTWSTQWQVPVLPDSPFPIPFYMVAINTSGKVVSLCPTLHVIP